MRLSTKGRFAVSAMLDLALRQEHGPVTLSTIGERQNISLSYLEQLFGKLRRAQLIESVRGPGGGYQLARPASDITVSEIVLAVDEASDANLSTGRDTCLVIDNEEGGGEPHDLWASLNQRIVSYLDSVTLKNLVDANAHRYAQIEEGHGQKRHASHAGSSGVSTFVRSNPLNNPAPNSVFALGGMRTPGGGRF